MPATHECIYCGATYDRDNIAAGNTRGLAGQDCIVDVHKQQHQWKPKRFEGGQDDASMKDVLEELQSFKLQQEMHIFQTFRRYKSETLHASDKTAEAQKFCDIAQKFLNFKVVRRKELLKLPASCKPTVRDNPFAGFKWATRVDEKTGKLVELCEDDATNVAEYTDAWKIELFGLVGNSGVVDAVRKEEHKQFAKDFTIDSDDSLTYLGFYCEEGTVGIIDLLLSKRTNGVASVNDDRCKDIVCGIELKPISKDLRYLQSELQLIILDIVFMKHKNERCPIIFQTQMSDEAKGSRCVAFYFEENKDYQANSGDMKSNDESDTDTQYFLVEQEMSSQYMLEWIKHLYSDSNKCNGSSENDQDGDIVFPRIISLQKQYETENCVSEPTSSINDELNGFNPDLMDLLNNSEKMQYLKELMLAKCSDFGAQ